MSGEQVGVLQVVAVVAWKSLQSFLTRGAPFGNQVLQAEYAMPFWVAHCSHGIFGSLNQATQHHLAQQLVGFSAELCYDLADAVVTHAYRRS